MDTAYLTTPYQIFLLGVITNMDVLPIVGFNYHGLHFESEKVLKYLNVKHIIFMILILQGLISYGPLVCKGVKPFSPGQSCQDLKLQGATTSGFYQVCKSNYTSF